MKNVIVNTLMLLMLVIAGSSYAQNTRVESTTGSVYGQMLVKGKTYTGNYLDTLTNNGTLYLSIVRGTNGKTAYNGAQLENSGDLDIKVVETKISGGVWGSIYLESSFDSVTWANEAYYNNYADTVALDSVNTTKVKTWHIKDKVARYYRVRVTVPSGYTQRSTYTAMYMYIRKQYITYSR